MKLIQEDWVQVEKLYEDAGEGKKNLFIHGPMLVGETVNKNQRWYPMSILERETERYVRDYVKENRAYGELDHPPTPTVSLKNVALIMTELHRDGKTYIGKAKITSHGSGAIARGLIEDGANPGVSSRGVGSLKMSDKGYNIVQEDFRLCVAADLVSDPSGPGCFVKGIMEDREWLYDEATGSWFHEAVSEAKKELKVMSREEREAIQTRLFEDFLAVLAGRA